MYVLYPSAALRQARARFAHYAISELHDEHGRPDYTAVLTETARPGALALLLRAPTLEQLCARLAAQPPRVPQGGTDEHA
ncbi:hypothetical protein [Murinocardiopsis flavida]|uniref:hypothetical protein n=1 Tax=Murinocardiopsis flavida TaxID=645275 RepID=UPI0011B231F0|nr:hypothetical protein [Murinocardiopsis flavida]